MKPDIKSMTIEELTLFTMEVLGEPKYRAGQIFQWLHKNLAGTFDEMTNLSKALREKLKEETEIPGVTEVTKRIGHDGTRKYLFELSDGNRVESVLMRQSYGNSVCISSQSGCRMGCTFCASTISGLKRSLAASEMLSQVYYISEDIGERVDHVVIMGMGEPLDNYENVLRFLRLISNEKGQNLSQRNLTISTCGIVPGIRRLADEKLQITLALSLHAPTQEKRAILMPVAKSFPLSDVMDACEYYFGKTGRRVTYEYSLISGQNDTDEEASELVSLLRGRNAHVNLIPVNPVEERGYREPDREVVMRFKNKLEKNGINSTIRKSMGRDIDGACGQLRLSYEKEVKK